MALIIPFEGKEPEIHPDAWVAPNATLIGNVRIGAKASVWFGAVLRGDLEEIVIGEGSNLQDNVVVHTDEGKPTIVGKNVGVGHLALLHGCTIEDSTLIGMGSKLLSGSHVGSGSLIAAGALLLEGVKVAPNHLFAGVPAKDRGPLSGEISERVRSNAFLYQQRAEAYKNMN